ncbi:MAG TPA: septum formation initiator family protein [Clostridia bacterium]|nr:septum formation initiator family protein [Clostridia bacterium]
MNAHVAIWEKLTRVVMFLLFLAGMLGLAVWYLPLIKQNERMRQQILKLDSHIQREKEIDKLLRVSNEALRNDPKAIERLARERLGYAKAGETVIRFEARSSPVQN